MPRITKISDYVSNIEIDWDSAAKGGSPFGTLQDFESELEEDSLRKQPDEGGYIVYEWYPYRVFAYIRGDEIVKLVFMGIGSVKILGIERGTLDQAMEQVYNTIEEHLGISFSKWYEFGNGIRSIIIQSDRGELVVLAQGDPITTLHVGTKAAMEKALGIVYKGAIKQEQFSPVQKPAEVEDMTTDTARVAISGTNALSEGKINLVSQGASVSVAREDLPTTSVSSLTSLGSSLGIRFDIDKIESKSSGLYGYGVESWKVFWQVIDSQKLKGATLLEGDTSATLSGRENVYCIAVQASSDTLDEIKTTLEQSGEFQQVAASTKFIEGGGLAGESLMDAGQVDLTGNYVGEENIPPYTAFEIVQRKKQSSPATAVSPLPTAESTQQPEKKWWQFWK
jgi:hypothetical protein